MDPFDHEHEVTAPQKINNQSDDYNDYFSHKPSKINDTIDFLNAETGSGQVSQPPPVASDLVNFAESSAADDQSHPKSVESLVDHVSDSLHAEVANSIDKVTESAQQKVEELGKKVEDNDLLGLSSSAVSHKEPVKPEVTSVSGASDHYKDLLFDEKEQDELKGFDQYTSDSNASLKVNLSCENDDTASTKSMDSAQSIPLDEKKNLAKESLLEDASEVLGKISEDTLVQSSKFSSPSPKETKSFVDSFESDFISQEAPVDNAFQQSSPPHVEPAKPSPKEEEVKIEKEIPKVSEQKPEGSKVKAPVKKAPSTEMFIGPHEVFSRFGLGKCFFSQL